MNTVGIIGGSGLYEMDGIESGEWIHIDTPYGDASDDYFVGQMDGNRLVFLPRHGRGHRILPSELNFRANIYGMKKLGVRQLIAVSAVGSLRGEIVPGDIVIPDQFIDRTYGRTGTFFGGGIVAHVAFADPVCGRTSQALARAARAEGATVHDSGTYICIEGPQFSTRAESFLYRDWGADVIGMTNVQEAKLAREAEMCFATLALATDYDCWNTEAGDVVIEDVLAILNKNVEMAKNVVRATCHDVDQNDPCQCESALSNGIITESALIPERVKIELDPIIGKYINR